MSEPKIYASMRVQCTIDIYVDAWGSHCNYDDMHQQVKREGRNKIERALKEHNGKIIGDLKMIVMTAEEKS